MAEQTQEQQGQQEQGQEEKKENKKKKSGSSLALSVLATLLALLLGGAATFAKHNGLFGKIKTSHSSKTEEKLLSETKKTDNSWVEYIDVGQGDCALVYSEGHYMLIDTGDRDESNTVINRLNELGVKKLDYLLLSHPHADHIGEAAEICQEFEIGSVIMPVIPEELLPDTMCYDELLESVDYIEPASDMSFSFGGCTFDTYAPFEYDYDLNNWSMLVRLYCGNCYFLFTGDCSFDEENSFLERGVWLGADVLKVGHHGSSYATSDEWLDLINPSISVISCGADNSYGHPSDETVERLYKHGSEVYITAELGSIVIETDGKTVWKK